MDFFKKAQEFAGSNNMKTDGDNSGAAATSDDGFGSFVNTASNMYKKSQGATPAGDGSAVASADGSLPGGRQAPTDQEVMRSGQLLVGAARGEKVDQSQLAGAASDVLGGVAARGHLDQGAYGKYINQAEDYLDKYSGQGKSQGQSAAPAKDFSDSAPGNARSTDDYAPDQQ